MAYVRTKEGQEQHDRSVAYWANQVINAGWSYVRSDLPGNPKPDPIGGHIPDVYAHHSNQEYVIEVETSDSKNSEHAQLQKVTFQKWANSAPGRIFQVKLV